MLPWKYSKPHSVVTSVSLVGLANNAMDAKRSWTTKYEEDDENQANTNNEGDTNENENDAVPEGARCV